MIIGVTATREGMTQAQKAAFADWLEDFGPRELHHGACVGGDEDAVKIAEGSIHVDYVIAHPPENESMLSETSLTVSDEVKQPRPYLERNRAIVEACDVLLACPDGPEVVRSGTWSTVRYARKQGRRVVVFWPDGEMTEEAGK